MLYKQCFDPVIDDRTRLLLAGSLPGEQSLALRQYYGNPKNQFWRLMSAVVDGALVAQDYPERLQALRQHGIGLRDVVAQARRAGSLDTDIRARKDNDLHGLLARYPNIRGLAFNGVTAYRLGTALLGQRANRYRLIALPSSSPAHTVPYADKLMRWMVLREAL